VEPHNSEPYDILIGWVAGAHGVRGEVRVMPETDYPQRFAQLDQIYLQPKNGPGQLYAVTAARAHTGKGQILLRLDGVTDREEAQSLKGAQLLIRESDMLPLEEGRYWEFQLLGLQVLTEEGRELGEIVNILRTGANDVYETPLALIPAIDQIIAAVDLQAGTMTVRWVDGLLK
jgi:16S rRNA processing protein RimM